MAISITRVKHGRLGARQINVILAALETSLNAAGALAIAGVNGLQAALDAKAAKVVPTYTVATLPDAAANAGVLIRVSDGNAGAACLALSNGADWKVIALGATAAAA